MKTRNAMLLLATVVCLVGCGPSEQLEMYRLEIANLEKAVKDLQVQVKTNEELIDQLTIAFFNDWEP